METAVLSKRIWLYIINLIFYLGVGFGAASPFIIIFQLHWALYLLIAAGIAIVFSFFFDILLLTASKGYTLGSAIMGVKYVASDGKRIDFKQAILRSGCESLLIFAIYDLFYFIKNRTERGAIDRLSDSFAIDMRR